ncbi:hypothetical protein [Streptomyces sp. NPDC058664]|uniref:hypothetical protein n=1 Tax=unclassified Streptomyces TaxID=2593676 RepID=UPI0036606340
MPATDPILPPTNGMIRRSGSAAREAAPEPETVSLDALAARRARSLPRAVRYELKGMVLTLPPWRSLPVDLPGRAGGDTLEILRVVLGEERIREMAAAGFTLGHLEVIGEHWRRRDDPGAGPGPFPPAGSRPGEPR